jgi:hypothetical protein
LALPVWYVIPVPAPENLVDSSQFRKHLHV